MTTLTNYEWKQDKEDEQGYYFILSDTLHHLDYNVLLVKDNGDIMVNGDYINNVPQHIAAAINPRLDYFMALKKAKGQCHDCHKGHDQKKPEEKKPETKKPEAKKTETKKPEEKKAEAKKADKKDKK